MSHRNHSPAFLAAWREKKKFEQRVEPMGSDPVSGLFLECYWKLFCVAPHYREDCIAHRVHEMQPSW
ncbi:MAG: hypothetical protein JW829_18305 [Pirellulales bacterium]|nr:hypothetical protein [Pirellulales bacterium]